MARNLALVEQDGACGVDPGCDIGGCNLADGALQHGRPAPDGHGLGDGVQIDHAVKAGMALLHLHPLLERAEIIAEMQRVRRLHSGEDARDEVGHGGNRFIRQGRAPCARWGSGPRALCAAGFSLSLIHI